MLNPDFRDILLSFDAEAVEYLIVARGRLEGLRVPILGRAHLIRNKRAVARPQDLADAQRLEDQER